MIGLYFIYIVTNYLLLWYDCSSIYFISLTNVVLYQVLASLEEEEDINEV